MDTLTSLKERRRDAKARRSKRNQAAPIKQIIPRSLFGAGRTGTTHSDPALVTQVPDTPQILEEPAEEPQRGHRKFSSASLSSIFLPIGSLTKRSPTVSTASSTELVSQSSRDSSAKSENENSKPVVSSEIVVHRPVSFQSVNNDKAMTRQRSKTLDDTKPELQSTGVLNTLANFVKVKRTNDEEDCSDEGPCVDLEQAFDGETPRDYITRLVETFPFNKLAAALSVSKSEFNRLCLAEFLRIYFDFSKEPLDLSLRKFLAFNELPRETQQIDRIVQAFSEQFYNCNSQAYLSVDVCYVLTFSLIMLHTDKFNPNSKKKMTKQQFKDNTLASLGDVADLTKYDEFTKSMMKDALDYFYDNTTHTPFIKYEGTYNENTLNLLQHSQQKDTREVSQSLSVASLNHNTPILRKRSSSLLWTSAFIDPYEYIVEDKTDQLRLDVTPMNINPFVFGGEDSTVDAQTASFDTSMLQKLHAELTQPRCSTVLRFVRAKATWLLNLNTKIGPHSGEPAAYFAVRVIKHGTVSRLESKRLGSGKLWRQYFCLLTSVGLLFYKDASGFTEANGIMDETEEGPAFCVPFQDLFASQMRTNSTPDTFSLFSQGAKSTYMADAPESWVCAIDCAAALSLCETIVVPLCIENTVEILRKHSGIPTETLIEQLQCNTDPIQILSTLSEMFASLMPYEAKTRDSACLSVKLLNAKLEWLWYEAQRNSLFARIACESEQFIRPARILSTELEKLDLES